MQIWLIVYNNSWLSDEASGNIKNCSRILYFLPQKFIGNVLTLCPFHNTDVLLSGGPITRSLHFVWVVHTKDGLPLIGHGFLTVSNSRTTVLQTLVTKKQPQVTFGSRDMNRWQNDQYLNSPYVAVLHWKMTESYSLMYTVDHTFGYCSQKFISTCTKSSAHAHGTEIRGGNFKQFKTVFFVKLENSHVKNPT